VVKIYVGKNFHKKVIDELKDNSNKYIKVLVKSKISYKDFKEVVDYCYKEDKPNER